MGKHLASWLCVLAAMAIVVGCGDQTGDPLMATGTGDATARDAADGQLIPTSNQGDLPSARKNTAGESGDGASENGETLKRESVEIEPYKGPPIFLDEPPDPLPATVVVSKQMVPQNYPDGSPYIRRQVTKYSDDRVVNDGSYREYYQNGQLFVEGHYDAGEQDGEWTYWHENGQKRRTVVYDHGLLNGSWEVYRADGTLEKKKEFKNGKPNGEWTTYDETGQELRQVMNYLDGKPNGTWKAWYDSGPQRSQYEFKNGVRHGPATEWDEDGNVRAKAMYQDGKLDGEVVKWDVDGKKYTQYYEDGRLLHSGEE